MTQAHWIARSPYVYRPVDEDGEQQWDTRHCDTITEAKQDAASDGHDAIRVYRRGRWGDTLVGTYVRRGDRLTRL